MYYEESIINGKLMFRNSPSSDWSFKISLGATATNHLMSLTEAERMDVFWYFCTHCGSDNPSCNCWDDS